MKDRAAILRSLTVGGHEGFGVVVKVGNGVTGLQSGDHAMTPFVAVCGHRRCCAAGRDFGL